jgi:putative thioredoxin
VGRSGMDQPACYCSRRTTHCHTINGGDHADRCCGAAATSAGAAQDFQKEVLEASFKVPVLVDFWAEWCGPCRMLSPLLEKLEKEYSGKWKLVKINTDHEPALAMQFNVTGIPHCVLFKNGKAVDSFTGALPERLIRNFLDKHILNEEKVNLLLQFKSDSKQTIRNAIEKALNEKIIDTEIAFYLWKYISLYIEEKNLATIKRILNLLVEQKTEYSSSALSLLDYLKKYENDPNLWIYLEKFIDLFDESKQKEVLEYFYQLIEQNLDKKQELKDHLIACFNILGQSHPLSNEYRKKLSRLLF